MARELSGRHDLSTPQEWQQWFRGAEPNLKQIPYRRWFDLMIAHPNLMAVNEFGGQINATNSVAPDLVPAFVRLAHAVPAGVHRRPCLTLLLYADRTEEAPLLIDDIEQEVRDYPTRFGDRNPMPGMILRWRFGVNYFWDVAAWRRWWADYCKVTT